MRDDCDGILSEEQVNIMLSGCDYCEPEMPVSYSKHVDSSFTADATQHICGCNKLGERLAIMEKEMAALKATTRIVIEAIVEISDVKQQTGNYYV